MLPYLYKVKPLHVLVFHCRNVVSTSLMLLPFMCSWLNIIVIILETCVLMFATSALLF